MAMVFRRKVDNAALLEDLGEGNLSMGYLGA
jgi:hypothetical protein